MWHVHQTAPGHMTQVPGVGRLENGLMLQNELPGPQPNHSMKTVVFYSLLVLSLFVNVILIGYIPLQIYKDFYPYHDQGDTQGAMDSLSDRSLCYQPPKHVVCGLCSTSSHKADFTWRTSDQMICCTAVAEYLNSFVKLMMTEYKRDYTTTDRQHVQALHLNLNLDGHYQGYRRLSWKQSGRNRHKDKETMDILQTGNYYVNLNINLKFQNTTRRRKNTFDIQIFKESTKEHKVLFRKSVRRINRAEVFDNALFFDNLMLYKGDEVSVVVTESEHVYRYSNTTWLELVRIN